VDGQQQNVLRANFTMQAIKLRSSRDVSAVMRFSWHPMNPTAVQINRTAVAFGPQAQDAEHTLFVPGERPYFFAFKNYGFARIIAGRLDRIKPARSQWPSDVERRSSKSNHQERAPPRRPPPPTVIANRSQEQLPEVPMTVKAAPAAVRVTARDRRLDNTLNQPVSGALQFDLPAGLTVEPEKTLFGPIQPKASATVGLTLSSNNLASGRHTVPYRISYRVGVGGKEVPTAALPLTVINGPTLQYVYEHPRPYYLIQSPGYTVNADMFNGLHRFLADDDDSLRLNGNPTAGRTRALTAPHPITPISPSCPSA
jgi:hypothetical protein